MRRITAGALVIGALAGVVQGQDRGGKPAARSLALFVDETWTDNVRFLDETDPDMVTRVGARAELKRTRSRGELALSADAAALQHARTSDLDQLFYGGRLSASRQLTRRTNVRLDESYRVAYSADQRGFSELAVAEPLSRSRTHDVHGDIGRQLSRRATAGLALRHTHVAFDEASRLASGDRLALQARLERETSRDGRLRLVAEREWSWTGEPTGAVSRLGTAWSGRLGPFVRLETGAGAVAVEGGEIDVQPFGSAALSIEGLRGSLGARYERSVGAAFGVGGLQSMDLFQARCTWRPSRRIAADADAVRIISRSQSSDALLASMDQVQANLRYIVGSRLALGAGYQLRRRESASAAVVPHAAALLLSISYSQDWR